LLDGQQQARQDHGLPPRAPAARRMKRIAILGSTGSVGQNALRLVDERRGQFTIAALTAQKNEALLLEQAAQFAPAAVGLVEGGSRPGGLAPGVAWSSGDDGVLAALAACDPDLVLNAISGAAGLPASEWTLRHGKTLALANKESLVMAGQLLTELARRHRGTLLPVDSEHCAIFQCLAGSNRADVRRIYLTGSGGPFRTRPLDAFASITSEQALQHPTWRMGPRITIGSATMMNKAFEVVEAHWLFGLAADQIRVLLHPQSIVHSLVEFVDGSILAQLGIPDMRVPILYCLGWPERIAFDFEPFDPLRFQSLGFELPDPRRYPALELGYEALRRGGAAGAVLNAADEVMTAAFLAGRCSFPQIAQAAGEVLRAQPPSAIASLADALRVDRAARAATEAWLSRQPPARTRPTTPSPATDRAR
jgi:1-deoxy-D-xylulose-5-phosphate reductoisomerase